MASQRESSLETYFRVAVRRAGGYTFKLAPTEAGVPDRLVIMPGGRLYLVELKREEADGGKLSPIQRHWHERIRQLGGWVYVLYGQEQAGLWILRVRDPLVANPR